MKKILQCLLFFSFLLIATTSRAQFNYQALNAVNTTSTYTDLGTNGTAINTKFNGGGPITYDDDTSSAQNIGFNFVFNGTTFTQFVLCSNGFIKLGNTAPASIYDVLSTPEANTISPFNYDLDGGSAPEYRLYTSGTSPNRVCTIQFKDVKDYSSTTGQYTSINFQIKLYETTNNIEFVYGTFTASSAASAFFGASVGVEGSSASSSVNVTKASTSAWSAATFLDGVYTGNKFNNRNSVLPTSGRTFRFVAVTLPPNDAAVQTVYALGKIPAGYNEPQTVKSVIKNTGSGTLTNLNVTLNVTGATTYTNTQTISSLAAGATSTVSFATFNPNMAGSNTITVSVPTDDLTTNNSASVIQTVNANTIGTSSATTTTTGVGSNTGTIEFATKFVNTASKSIDQVTLYFPTSSTGQPYTVLIYDATGTGGTPGTALWTSASQTTAGANVNLSVSPAVTVNGDFFVSIQQTGTTNVGYGYETENPIRTGTFYLKSPIATGTWGDMAPANNFKLLVDARFSAGLPITLTNFTGITNAGKNILNWGTTNETNNKGFELQRSINCKDFSTIGNINSKGDNGNSNTELKYSYTDENPLKGTNYYRLYQFDKDGKGSYSKVVAIKNSTKGVEISNVYPNPAKDNISLTINSLAKNQYTISIYDLVGKEIARKSIDVNGSMNVQFNTSDFAKGTYVIKVTSSENTVLDTQRFIKQ